MTSQLDRIFRPEPNLPQSLQIVLKGLAADWNNILTDKQVRRWRELIKAQAPLKELEKLISLAAGGPRKPDMLGISTQVGIQLDGVEVGTEKTAADTYKEMRNKLNDIGRVSHKIIALLNSELKPSVPYTDSQLTISPSHFRLAEHEMIYVIPIALGPTGNARTVTWICYNPSTAWYPTHRPLASGPDPRGTDGLILYHIHEVTLPNAVVPTEILAALKTAVEAWLSDKRIDLELNPALRNALRKERSDWAPEARLLFSCFGVGALALLGGWVALELGAAVGAATDAASMAETVRRMIAFYNALTEVGMNNAALLGL